MVSELPCDRAPPSYDEEGGQRGSEVRALDWILKEHSASSTKLLHGQTSFTPVPRIIVLGYSQQSGN